MQYLATQKYTRQTPRKVRLVANTIKDLTVEEALRQLAVMDRKSTVVVLKTLRQVIANALHNHNALLADLTLKEITINEGPRYRRFRSVSRGRAHGVIKRTCHIRIVLEDKKVAPTAEAKKLSVEAAVVTDKAESKVASITTTAPAKVSQKSGQVKAQTAAQTTQVRAAVKKAGNK